MKLGSLSPAINKREKHVIIKGSTCYPNTIVFDVGSAPRNSHMSFCDIYNGVKHLLNILIKGDARSLFMTHLGLRWYSGTLFCGQSSGRLWLIRLTSLIRINK